MEFVIASTNATKVKAATIVLESNFQEVIITSKNIESGVNIQPYGLEETRNGAMNRSIAASEFGIGIGLEGGVYELGKQLYLCNWGALTLNDQLTFTAGGAQIPLPEEVAKEIRAGKELGPTIDAYYSRQGIRHSEGAIGMLTMGAINRTVLFEHVMHLLVGQFKYHNSKL